MKLNPKQQLQILHQFNILKISLLLLIFHQLFHRPLLLELLLLFQESAVHLKKG